MLDKMQSYSIKWFQELQIAKFLLLKGGEFMEWLKEIRTDKNFTQSEVASKTKLSESFYCQIEKGVRKPSVANAKQIAALLQFDWTRFFEQKETG